MSAFLQGNVFVHIHATAHTIVRNQLMYMLCLPTVTDDRHEKEERKTKHDMYTVALNN